jgi:hypothetical protein
MLVAGGTCCGGGDGETLLYRTKARDCRGCLLKAQCCPKTSVRKIPRSIYEESRDVARALAKTEAFKQSSRDRKRVEMLFAHLIENSKLQAFLLVASVGGV